ncbi:hybrid-cluster NAD(P)-dependent oxidoreductase [Pacificibacter marinus]|uniref:hybrid-cluster NAD(P)-dependent oxidoreductase n=1 Tax=Pacificibacter marinus TaxID=658057 RepID=UPI001C06FB58|nr:hybrid-cluster NAD(P)-dependent oxidoreductase [Pacificibacter marinus]MBU2867319.1 hybrid-cluster NAD(P)-dependent oxidoreductase [Pacificibacter marinus]
MANVNDRTETAIRNTWTDTEVLECVAVRPEIANTATFSFRAPSGALFEFDPGQFITLEIPAPSGTVHRTYTISSSPSRPYSIDITAKAQEGSIGTRWMLDHLKLGMRLKAVGPLGSFTNASSESTKFLFISAGSGVTPMMSMTTFLLDKGCAPDIAFVHCARKPSELVFRQSLEKLANKGSGLDVSFVVTAPDAALNEAWNGHQGRLTPAMLEQIAPDYLDRDVYCCGPESFMRSVEDALITLGHDMSRYHEESFGAPARNAAETTASTQTDTTTEVHFEVADRRHPCAPSDTVLAAAKEAGISIPTGCTFGLCGTCKVKKTAGDVHMAHNGGISEQDIAAGYILACCSKPLGKVSIQL